LLIYQESVKCSKQFVWCMKQLLFYIAEYG